MGEHKYSFGCGVTCVVLNWEQMRDMLSPWAYSCALNTLSESMGQNQLLTGSLEVVGTKLCAMVVDSGRSLRSMSFACAWKDGFCQFKPRTHFWGQSADYSGCLNGIKKLTTEERVTSFLFNRRVVSRFITRASRSTYQIPAKG